MWQEDKIVLVRGKDDLRGDSANILCEEVRDYVVRAQAADDGEDPYASLRTGPVFRDANGKGSDVASFVPAAPVEEELADPLLRRTYPPGDTRIEAVTVDGKRNTSGLVEVEMTALGLASRVGFHLVNGDLEYFTVIWEPLLNETTFRSGKEDIS